MAAHYTLRAANIARQAEWDADSRITLTYRLNELAGETGEACNVGKKLERERLGIRGSRATVQDLADELADVVICADLVALGEGIDLAAAVARKFNATSEKVGLETRLAEPGPSALLLAARAVHAVRPTNWDDDEDPAQREAWAALEAALKPSDEDGEACGICALAFVEGDPCLTDVDLGAVHAGCCGPEPESYVNLDTGEPLKPGEPLPTPWIWSTVRG